MRSGEFISMMEVFFRRPGERVLGKETADDVFDRIDEAIEKVVTESSEETVAVVSHGTALALFLAEYGAEKNEFELWRSMGLPSYAVMTMPDYEIVELVERI
jgi:broad specificity phosphatase PhoE